MGQFLYVYCKSKHKCKKDVAQKQEFFFKSSSKCTNIGLNCTRIVVGRTKSNYGIKGLEAFLLCLISWPLRAVNTEGAGGQLPQSVFGKSVNPIPTRWGRLCPPYYYWPPIFLDDAASLSLFSFMLLCFHKFVGKYYVVGNSKTFSNY